MHIMQLSTIALMQRPYAVLFTYGWIVSTACILTVGIIPGTTAAVLNPHRIVGFDGDSDWLDCC